MDNPNQTRSSVAPEPFPAASLLGERAFRRALRHAMLWPMAVLVAAMGLLLGLLVYLFFMAGRVDHSNAVLAQISRVEKLAVDMETGVRGYRITGDDTFLEPFQRARAVFSNELDALEKLVRDNTYQLNEAQALRRAHAAWGEFATNVRQRVQTQLPADLAAHLHGKELMEKVREHIGAMQQHERRLLAERAGAREQLRRVSLSAVVLFAVGLAPILAMSVRRTLMQLNRSYHAALGTVENEREQLHVTLSSIGDAVLATDAQGRVTYMNAVAVELTGWRLEEAAGQPLAAVFKIINEHSRKSVENPVENVLRDGRIVGLANHTLLVAKDGREIPIADSAAPIRDASGGIIGVVLVFRDQTAERDAARRVEWLASFPGRNPNPVMELHSETGEVTYANSFASKVFPDLHEQGLRHPFFGGWKEVTKPLFEGKTEFVRREITVGTNCYAQTISYLPEARRLRVYCNDITATKNIEAALRESEERYRSLFESIDEGFCVIEMIFDANQKPVDYRFIEVNPAFERQAGMHGATGKRMLEFVSEIEPHWLENYGRVALTGEPIRFADEYKSLGSWFDVYAFRVGDPRSRRVAVIFNNITERKKTEAALLRSRAELADANQELASRAVELDRLVEMRTAELRETVQQLETFSYSIVHDMRAPLRSMRSFAGFLQEGYSDRLDDAARDYLRRIMDSAARMDVLITDVLNYSRVSRGSTDLAPVNLDRLVPEIIEQYPNLHDKAASIHISRPLPKVTGNTALLTQVFSNLLANALKFVSEGREPQVQIRAEKNCDTIRIWIEDNGIGVPPEHHDRIFGLFQRLHRPDQFAGTGVGLAIVKRAVEKMGGRAGVESQAGAGSRFWIDLRAPELSATKNPDSRG